MSPSGLLVSEVEAATPVPDGGPMGTQGPDDQLLGQLARIPVHGRPASVATVGTTVLLTGFPGNVRKLQPLAGYVGHQHWHQMPLHKAMQMPWGARWRSALSRPSNRHAACASRAAGYFSIKDSSLHSSLPASNMAAAHEYPGKEASSACTPADSQVLAGVAAISPADATQASKCEFRPMQAAAAWA